MDSDDDFEPLPSSPVHERKLKRLKKATRVYENPLPITPPTNSSELEVDARLEEPNRGSVSELKSFANNDVIDTVEVEGLGAKRVLDFDSVGDELEEKATENTEGVANLKTDELERLRLSIEEISEKKENKKRKKKFDDEDGSEKKKHKEPISNKRKTEKERRENLKQLRAESQRLLRETRDAAFKPVPVVQKPISSILDKIRQRKLEILKKANASFDENDDSSVDGDSDHSCPSEAVTIKSKVDELEETPTTCPAVTENNSTTPHIGGSNDDADNSSHENIPSPLAMGSESVHVFRAPNDDTQDLFPNSQTSDTNDGDVNEKLNYPSEGVFGPSMLPMNLRLDSAPLDDDVSSDDEYNDKENMDPHLHGSVDLTVPPSGDPVKAFVDEEAEEEDDSDNDLQRFQDNEEEGEDDDIEELNDMIATEYEEKPVDRERRDELHQKWLEQQDTAGMDNLLQKLNCGSNLKESISIEEEDEESKESENESDNEVEDYIVPSDAVKANLKKVKQMIPQMFTDKEDAYVSSDEETEERLAKQCLSYRVEEKAQLFSPLEDESSREVFSLIKKLNIVPDTKRKGKTPSIFDMPHIGQNITISSKSSFVGRASNHFMPSSQKHGSSKGKSYIFGRDDSNSRTSVSMSEDSSDTIQRGSQPLKAPSAKFQRNTQNKYATSSSEPQKSNVSLLEILRSSSLHTERSVQNTGVRQEDSVSHAFNSKAFYDAFKLPKKLIKTKTDAKV